MKINPVIHHHFKFSSAILKNTEHCRNITFESIPFFKLYELKHLKEVRDIIDTLSAVAMPHKYQKILLELRPPEHLEDSHHRVDRIPMTYCVYNRQSFFVRAYQMRYNNFFKIEIVLHSDTLGARNHYTFKKALKGAQGFFKQIDTSVLETVSYKEHLPEYFFVDDFEREVRALQNSLKSLRNCNHSVTKERLIREFQTTLKSFQKNAKEIARDRLNLIEEIKQTKVICANLLSLP